jgi:hypothetical protein
LMNTQPPTTLSTGVAPPCPECDRMFSSGSDLKDHMRNDHGIRAFQMVAAPKGLGKGEKCIAPGCRHTVPPDQGSDYCGSCLREDQR